jgi:hypothetical protein
VIEWLNIVTIAIAVVAGVLCVVLGLAGRQPNDFTLGATALVELALLVMFVVALAAPAFGNGPTGDPLEFWVYLISALLLPPAAAVWALIDRSRWSNVVLGVACLAIAIMVYRMGQIWFVQAA